MSVVKKVLLAGGLSLALAATALAQGERGRDEGADQWNLGSIQEGQGVVLNATGRSARQKVGTKGHATLAAHRVELPARTMIYKKGGKLYLVTDKKLPDNSMLFDQAKGWEQDSN